MVKAEAEALGGDPQGGMAAREEASWREAVMAALMAAERGKGGVLWLEQ